jgi:hypothetical protein
VRLSWLPFAAGVGTLFRFPRQFLTFSIPAFGANLPTTLA